MARPRPPEAARKRSVTIGGHRTSVSLEGPFWDELARIAAARGRSLNGLVAEIDAARIPAAGGAAGNLSGALRLFVLAELRRAAAGALSRREEAS